MCVLSSQAQMLLCVNSSIIPVVRATARCSPTCRTEEEGLGFSQVLVHGISDNHLSLSEGAESLFISGTYLTLNVIKKQREAPAAKLLHLADTEVSLKVNAALKHAFM